MRKSVVTAFMLAAALAAAPASAGPPWSGPHEVKAKGKGKGHPRGRHEEKHVVHHFVHEHRVVVREYYADQHRRGHCPPGLAKKNNGCMPPGLAKKWKVGRPLPREVIYYEVPPALVVKIGTPPPGHRYVRVAGDILMIAVGTAMVVSAIEDLGRM
jgi:hypothetical protein